MINLKPAILQALEGNQALVNLLGGPWIWWLKGEASKDAYVTFFELTNVDSLYADDEAVASEIHVQVDVWTKDSPTAIAEEVDKTMKALGFRRYSAVDLYEEDTGVYHKALRYRTGKLIEEV